MLRLSRLEDEIWLQEFANLKNNDVSPIDVLKKGEKLEDQRVVWRIYHDIMDPTSGYTPEQQQMMVQQLNNLTEIDFSKESGDLGTMMSEMRGRTGGIGCWSTIE